MYKLLFVCYILIFFINFTLSARRSTNQTKFITTKLRQRKAQLIQDIKKLKKKDGAVKLVGGTGNFEGNVEILHNGKWGAVCDDEWDLSDATVVCRQLGFTSAQKYMYSSAFGLAKRRYWMDNVFCDGTENELSECRFDGWGNNDCTVDEAAGVICRTTTLNERENDVEPFDNVQLQRDVIRKIRMPSSVKTYLVNGRTFDEGYVKVEFNDDKTYFICGDGWSLLEAMVVCRSLNLGYAYHALQYPLLDTNITDTMNKISGVRCRGNEMSLDECFYDEHTFCPDTTANPSVAGVVCIDRMADLVLDHLEIMKTAHLEDRQMFFLQCAMEENCLASQAYKIQRESDSWHLETRRLLKFTARSFNAGTDDFRPSIPKHLWEWHMCHMHYHSMEVFATFDIYNENGTRVAEGHKASFCLEDNQCLPGITSKYACKNYGDQGISVNCSDIYKYDIDCQWIDVSEIDPGLYTLKVAVNPEFKVPEISFENNAAICTFDYRETGGRVYDCTVTRP